MVSSGTQKPACPVCNRTDQVKTMQAAYESGKINIAPPELPVAKVSMMRYIITGIGLVAVGAFFILIATSSTFGEVIGSSGFYLELAQVIVTIIFIVAALVLSIRAFLKVGAADRSTRPYLFAWDNAMEHWRRLRYCARDNVIFDPQTNKTLTDSAARQLLALNVDQIPEAQAHSAVASQK